MLIVVTLITIVTDVDICATLSSKSARLVMSDMISQAISVSVASLVTDYLSCNDYIFIAEHYISGNAVTVIIKRAKGHKL